MKKVAVVILNYNGESFLRQFLPKVIEYSPSAEVIVADNASTDGSLALLKREFGKVRIIELTENHGYAGGYNEALSQVDTEYYMLLNSDVEVTKGWLEPLVSFLDQNSAYAGLQPKVMDFNNRSNFEYAGAAGGFLDKYGYPYCRGRIFDSLEEDHGQYNNPVDVFWCSGACFLIRSSDFDQSGGFDKDFFAHMEEIDLCWRLLRSGRKLACVPSVAVYHVGGGTLNKTSPRKTYLNFRNNLMMLGKNLSVGRLIVVLPPRLVLDMAASIKMWKDQSFGHVAAIFHAYWDFLIQLRQVWKKRKPSITTVNPGKNLIFQYYIRGKRTFEKISNTK